MSTHVHVPLIIIGWAPPTLKHSLAPLPPVAYLLAGQNDAAGRVLEGQWCGGRRDMRLHALVTFKLLWGLGDEWSWALATTAVIGRSPQGLALLSVLLLVSQADCLSPYRCRLR